MRYLIVIVRLPSDGGEERKLPSRFLLTFPSLSSDVYPLYIPYVDGFGALYTSSLESRAEPQPKSNLVHLKFNVWWQQV